MAAKERDIRQAKDAHPLTVRLPADVHDALRTCAFVMDTSVNDLIVRATMNFLTEEGHRQAVEGHLRRAQQQYRIALDKLAGM